jgi:hypothetical protein
MPRAEWPLLHGRPVIQVLLTLVQGGQQVARQLLADTGAGTATAGFELLLDEQDCLLCGGIPLQGVVLGGAYSGSYPVYLVQVCIPLLGFDRAVPAVGVPAGPAGFDGIACFPFLNRFTYGNFADPGKFGLET